jgi:hypothetical protein
LNLTHTIALLVRTYIHQDGHFHHSDILIRR